MNADVLVVGGGAIGVSAAYELARTGRSVLLLERGETLASGCSAGNAGLISPSHSMPLANPAARRELVASLRRADSPLSLRARPGHAGWLARFAAASGSARAEAGRHALEALATAGLALHAELAPLGTSFERRGILGVPSAGSEGVLHPDEAQVDPQLYVAAIADAARAAGATLRTGEAVRSLSWRDGSASVESSAGDLRPATVVLAAGVWTSRLARGLGLFVPLLAGKGHHVDLATGPGDPDVAMLLHGPRLSVTPYENRIRVAGRVELTGLDDTVREPQLAAIRADVERFLPDLAGRRVVHTWAGLRPCTPDGLPVIGRAPSAPGVVIATGHAMKGIALAPVTARLVSELVAGEPPSHDLAPFSPGRFRPLRPR